MKKHILCIISLVFIIKNISSGQTGYLDNTFGDGGKVVTKLQGQDSHGNAVAVQSDGKILLAGYANYAEKSDFILIRYNTDGSVDSLFGARGKVFADFGSSNEFAQSVAVQQDQKIVLAGGTNDFFALVRFSSDGLIDSLFGEHGKVKTDITGYGHYMCGSLAVQQDGKILLAGSIGYYGALIRYNIDGSPDDSFGEEGIVIVDFGNMGDEYVLVSMAVQQDNKIVVAGFSFVSDYDFTVLRFNEDGIPDSTFGDNGKVTADIFNSPDDRATAIALQQDGKILVAGWSGIISDEKNDWDLGIIRFNSDGTPDNSFGNEGRILSDLNNLWDDRAESLAVQHDGKILVAGYTYTVGYSDISLARYNTNGTPDTTFSGDGVVTTDIGNSSYDYGKALVVQEDGKILVAGTSDNNIVITRYLSELNISHIDFSTAPDNMLVYPAPVINEAILKYYLERDDIIDINLYDNTGRKIQNFVNKEKRQKGGNSEILIFNSALSSGHYILELITSEKKASIKILKQ